MARPRRNEAAVQVPLDADLIQLIEVIVAHRQSRWTGYMVHSQSFRLARGCGIPKVFVSDRFDEMSVLAGSAGLRLEIARTIRH